MVKKSKRRAKQSRRLSRRRRPKRITRARQKKRGIYKSRRTSRKNCKDTEMGGGFGICCRQSKFCKMY